jgi:SnoaL-like domain
VIDAETYTAIEQLQRAYGDVASRAAWHEVGSLLTDEAHIQFTLSSGAVFEIVGVAAFVEFAEKMASSPFFEYIPLSFVVSRGADGSLVGRTYSLEVAENDAGEWVESYGLYEDTYDQVDGRWRFARRLHRTIKQRVTTPGS